MSSLKEIAIRCGTSVSTVSRILNNSSPGCAAEELKQKVWQAARELEYSPNQHARELKRSASEAAAAPRVAVVPARHQSLDADPFFRELYRCLEIELFAAGCIIDSTVSAADLLTAGRRTDGVIVLGRCTPELPEQLRGCCRELVCVSRNPLDHAADEVICSGKQAAKMALEYLLELGHRRIAYIGDCSQEERYTGYCETLIDNRLPLDYRDVFPTDMSSAAAEEAMRQVIGRTDITAVLCANDASALGALRSLHDQRSLLKKQKRRISVISIDNIEEAQNTSPLLTTVNIPRADMARMAVLLLLDRLRGGHREFVRIELPCSIVKRESCFRVE